MKSTGIIRRIDDLGRIVIPKEMRKTLGISNNDELEIYVENNAILLQKYKRLLNLKEASIGLFNAISKNIDFNMIITDNDGVVYSTDKINFPSSNLSLELKNFIMERKIISSESKSTLKITKDLNVDCYYIICPIIIDGNILGSIVSFSEIENKTMSIITKLILDILKEKL